MARSKLTKRLARGTTYDRAREGAAQAVGVPVVWSPEPVWLILLRESRLRLRLAVADLPEVDEDSIMEAWVNKDDDLMEQLLVTACIQLLRDNKRLKEQVSGLLARERV